MLCFLCGGCSVTNSRTHLFQTGLQPLSPAGALLPGCAGLLRAKWPCTDHATSQKITSHCEYSFFSRTAKTGNFLLFSLMNMIFLWVLECELQAPLLPAVIQVTGSTALHQKEISETSLLFHFGLLFSFNFGYSRTQLLPTIEKGNEIQSHMYEEWQ